ncbi:hypothetical protein SAMN04488542_11384 [Fontibacillus panacisegetis]|uniref:Signal peptidase I n=1 Tax=Fontibacillus panacisegetis TaxID=670482 RepID=A0A1G7ME74_9BACL|nr:DUF5684 domain-containing protein [Fontibacillus panacisegetis]SDF60063.1 hypothetical protein SAMN04488542_11384 [Fontibacillus panacisegetis]
MELILPIIYIAFYLVYCGAFFSLAKKAGLDHIAWFAFIPILSTILQLRMIKQSGWWILMMLVPIANFVFAIIWQVKLLNAFGKNGAFVLFIFLGPVYSILWMVWGYSQETRYYLNDAPQNPTFFA